MITHHFERKIFINNEVHGVIHIICLSYEFIMNFCMFTLDFFYYFFFGIYFHVGMEEEVFLPCLATNDIFLNFLYPLN